MTARPHRPGRPHWRCTACGAPWPCSPARLDLLAEYGRDRVALCVYLVTRAEDARQDFERLGLTPDPALLTRFTAWARSRESVTKA
ncbi:hypothetical protein GCM10010429_02440 [Micromonospora olivasterospora]|uniref:Flavin reductase n=1 Tax=Micromonospora olivasterospora TaxID=1880 RepID=A0A562IBT7_MICOL|nr:hypothetical protein JD77_03443 [Micromonospora olivasterospora]